MVCGELAALELLEEAILLLILCLERPGRDQALRPCFEFVMLSGNRTLRWLVLCLLSLPLAVMRGRGVYDIDALI